MIQSSKFNRLPFLILAVWLLALILTGCSSDSRDSAQTEEIKSDTRTYQVYYTNLEGTALTAKSYTPESTSFEGILSDLLKQFQLAPSEDVKSALPSSVKINHVVTGVDSLTVDFDSGYLSLTNVEQVLLRAGIVKTLVQLPGVYRVSLTSDDQPLVDVDGTEMPAMNDETFIDSGGAGINSYHYVDVKLYFVERDGHLLRDEERSLFYSSNVITERVIVEQIIKGPTDKELMAVTSPTVQVLDVRTTDHICTIDLDSAFNQTYDESISPEIELYAFVNSICDSCGDVRGVRFQIDGESDIRFRGQVNLDQTFTRASEYIDDGAREENVTETETPEETSAAETGTPDSGVQSESSTEVTDDSDSNAAVSDIDGTAAGSSAAETGKGVGVDPSLVESTTDRGGD